MVNPLSVVKDIRASSHSSLPTNEREHPFLFPKCSSGLIETVQQLGTKFQLRTAIYITFISHFYVTMLSVVSIQYVNVDLTFKAALINIFTLTVDQMTMCKVKGFACRQTHRGLCSCPCFLERFSVLQLIGSVLVQF